MKNKILLLMLSALLAGIYTVQAGVPEEGKVIFMSRCAGCHNVNKVLTGPALSGVDTRHSINWIINFVHSSQTVVKSGDKDAVALFNRFNRITMPDHTDLTAENIKNIVEYIRKESIDVSADSKAPFATPSELKTSYHPLSIQKDYVLFSFYLFAVALLVAILLFVVRLKSFREKNLEEKSL